MRKKSLETIKSMFFSIKPNYFSKFGDWAMLLA